MLPRRGWERDGDLSNSHRGTRASPTPSRPPLPCHPHPETQPGARPLGASRQPKYCCSLPGFEQWKRHLLKLFLPSLMSPQVCVKRNYIDYSLHMYWNLKLVLYRNLGNIMYSIICILAFCHSCLCVKDCHCILHHSEHRYRCGLCTHRIWSFVLCISFLATYLLEVCRGGKLFVFCVPGPARFPCMLNLKHISNHIE